MLVGNDVVDLRDPENQPRAIHPRFDLRAFTAEERDWLTEQLELGSDAAHRDRWRLWAAKESAFKVARKLDPHVRFHPRAFGVSLVGRSRAVVHHAIGRFDVWLSGGDEWVHAVSAPMARDSDRPSSRLGLVRRGVVSDEGSGRDEIALASGARVRAVARSAVAAALSLAAADVEIASSGRIPIATWRQARLPVDLSLSHHGRFVGCAWRLTG